VGFLSGFLLRQTERAFAASLRVVLVTLFSDLHAHYSSEMDGEAAATLAGQVTNFLKGEDVEEIARLSEEPLRTQIMAVLPQVAPRAAEKMEADRQTREIVVATLRMTCVLMFGKHGKAWFNTPAKDRIESLLAQYGPEFPGEIKPDAYQKLAAAYHEVKRSFVEPRSHPQITFRDFLVKHALGPGGQLSFTEEEQHAIDAGWLEFPDTMNRAGAPLPDDLLPLDLLPPDMLRTLQDQSASSALFLLALKLMSDPAPSAIRPPDSTARQRACSAAAKSVVLNDTPLHIYVVARVFLRAEEPSLASCLYREFLALHEKAASQAQSPEQVTFEQNAVQEAKDWLSRFNTPR
jgi:hypothetical protein